MTTQVMTPKTSNKKHTDRHTDRQTDRQTDKPVATTQSVTNTALVTLHALLRTYTVCQKKSQFWQFYDM